MSRNPGYIMVVENTPERNEAQRQAWLLMYERELAEATDTVVEIEIEELSIEED